MNFILSLVSFVCFGLLSFSGSKDQASDDEHNDTNSNSEVKDDIIQHNVEALLVSHSTLNFIVFITVVSNVLKTLSVLHSDVEVDVIFTSLVKWRHVVSQIVTLHEDLAKVPLVLIVSFSIFEDGEITNIVRKFELLSWDEVMVEVNGVREHNRTIRILKVEREFMSAQILSIGTDRFFA